MYEHGGEGTARQRHFDAFPVAAVEALCRAHRTTNDFRTINSPGDAFEALMKVDGAEVPFEGIVADGS